MIWLLENRHPLQHLFAFAISWGALIWIALSYAVDPLRPCTKWRRGAKPMGHRPSPLQPINSMLIVKKERLDERTTKGGFKRFLVTTWYVLFIPVFRYERLLPINSRY